MNFDAVTAVWRSQDLSPLYRVDKAVLHQVLRQEQARLEKHRRTTRWFMYLTAVMLFIMAALFFAIMFDPNQPSSFAARRTVGDYVVGGIGLASAAVLAGVLLSLRRSREARERGFGDSIRDHLRRRIAQLDGEATRNKRTALLTNVTAVTCATAISIMAARIRHEPVPWSEIAWPSPPGVILFLAFIYLLFFRWIPRERQANLSRKRQLEALLRELEG